MYSCGKRALVILLILMCARIVVKFVVMGLAVANMKRQPAPDHLNPH